MNKYINVYRLTDEYGGPEEGGWWYTAGEPEVSLRVEFGDRTSIEDVVGGLLSVFPDNGNRRSTVYEVVADKPTDYLVVVEDHAAREFPEERPRYE